MFLLKRLAGPLRSRRPVIPECALHTFTVATVAAALTEGPMQAAHNICCELGASLPNHILILCCIITHSQVCHLSVMNKLSSSMFAALKRLQNAQKWLWSEKVAGCAPPPQCAT